MIATLIMASALLFSDDHGHTHKADKNQGGSHPPVAKPQAKPTVKPAPTPTAHKQNFNVQVGISAAQAFKMLQEGNKRFTSNSPAQPNQDQERRLSVALKQAPFAAILGCADSRLSPEILFDRGIGDLFVVRVAGNVADTFGIASLEYAVEHLGSKLIVVMGHERCGAVKAAVDTFSKPAMDAHADHEHDENAQESIPALLQHIKPAVTMATDYADGEDTLKTAIVCNVQLTMNNLVRRSSLLRELNKKGEIKIVGAYYDLDEGFVKFLNYQAK
jgi:carbonic anhydrase